MEKHKKFVELVDPVVRFVLDFKEDGTREQALIKLQEVAFWIGKLIEDEAAAKKN